ncbi:ABC transporter substrate-binding protein [Paenibacillus cisolokensis]|uniref:ABC transporter substrate-binding protein n=1 Tax=Paenibacillus cisolokensis TaxID=1658519 RepID=A0ABQ4N101_9BACL|nr:ABC transporter substrate-binding protein [Paenibacillus cisolokensis]GIQ61857.1 ABC transporter substrate-binding protein [Paenibacillus cisolokensis]
MKRKIWSVLTAVILILTLLAGCSGGAGEDTGNTAQSPATNDSGSGQTNNGDAQPEPGNDPVTISFWHIHSDGDMKDTMTELLADFMKQHPDITVNELGINFWDYWTKLSTAMAGGSGPDLAMNDTSTLQTRAESGAILNLNEFIQRDSFNTEDFFPVLIDKMKYNDGIYGLPSDTDVRVLYYNKTAFREANLDPEKPPANWDELAEYAEKLTVLNDSNLIERIGFSPALGNIHLWMLAWANGGDFWDDEGKPTYDRPENLEALQWMKTVQDKYGVKAMSAFNSQASALQHSPFIAGKAAMIVDVNNLYTDIKKYAPDLDFGVAPIPYTKQPATWSAGFDYEIVNNHDDKRAAAAWELLKYLTSPEVQKKIHQVSGSLVSNMKAAKAPEFMADPVWEMIVGQMEHSRFIEYIPASPSWHAELDQVVQSVLNSGVDPQKALQDAQKNAETKLKNYVQTK